MDRVQIINNYQYFFGDQIREIEFDQKKKVNTTIAQLLRTEGLCYGIVDNVSRERGHLIIKFPKNKGPRLKVLKSLTIAKQKAFDELGQQPEGWTCTLREFLMNNSYRAGKTDLLPLYYMNKGDVAYEYVGCSSVELELFNVIETALQKGKKPRVLVFDPFPPVDLLNNLNNYLANYSSNDELYIKPRISLEDWHPEELAYDVANPVGIANRIMETLDKEGVCILQGPPGSGKSYTIAQILASYLKQGKSCCATTMANKGVIELVQQPPLKEALQKEIITKGNLTADEKHQVPKLRMAKSGQYVANGELLCVTNYVLSFAFTDSNMQKYGLPSYDLIVIEEASQAFLTSIAAFKSLGKKCLIVGDPMQLPPIVQNRNKALYKSLNADTQIEGLLAYALGTDIKSFRITTTFRLTPKAASFTGTFYNDRFQSVKRDFLCFDEVDSPLFPNDGGVIYHCTGDVCSKGVSRSAFEIIDYVINTLSTNYPKRSVAVISPFKETVKQLQKHFSTNLDSEQLTIETIDRIQGMTVDYAVVYFPADISGFAFDERRFNVATSRSRSTTLILSDLPIDNLHILTPRIRRFLRQSISTKCIDKSKLPLTMRRDI